MPETQNMSPLASWLPQTLGRVRAPSRGAAPHVQAEAVLTIAQRIAQRREPLARQILERVRAEPWMPTARRTTNSSPGRPAPHAG
jgi:hypothetical protein